MKRFITFLTILALAFPALAQSPITFHNATKVAKPGDIKGISAPVFLSPTGSDSADGTRAHPLATSAAALAAINNNGEVVLLSGDYTNLKFNIAGIKDVKIRGETGSIGEARIRVFLGEHKTVFTNTAGNIWQCNISTVIPLLVYATQSSLRNEFIFESDTPTGLIGRTISALGGSPSTATVTLNGKHGIPTGATATVVISGITDGSYSPDINGTHSVTATSGTSFTVTGVTATSNGTPSATTWAEGVAMAHDSEKARFTRLDHFPLKQVATAGGGTPYTNVVPGTYFYNSATGILYFNRTDNANPNSTGSGVWIPSQTDNQDFIYGATGGESIEVDNIEAYYGRDDFDFTNCKKVVTHNILAFGAGFDGIREHFTGYSEHWNPEFAANSEDGFACTGTSDAAGGQSESLWHYPWAHDNGDQGMSAHAVSICKTFGGLMEWNENGGFFGGGQTEAHGVLSRYNTYFRPGGGGGGFGITIGPGNNEFGVTMDCNGCYSDHDYYGFYATANPGRMIVRNGGCYNATNSAFTAGGFNVMTVSNMDVSGNTNLTAGSGTVTLSPGGSSGKFGIAQGHPIRGTNAYLQIDPEGSSTTSLGNPMMLLGGENNVIAVNDISSIGAGYTSSAATKAPVEFGAITTDANGSTKGTFFVGTRDSITGTDLPTLRLQVGPGGEVSVGTLPPTINWTFSVDGVRSRFTSAGATTSVVQVYPLDSAHAYFGTFTDTPLIFRTHDTDAGTIDTSGRFGFGNVAPSERVDVTGNIKASGSIKATSNLTLVGPTYAGGLLGFTEASGIVNIGDIASNVNGTYIKIDDTASTITLHGVVSTTVTGPMRLNDAIVVDSTILGKSSITLGVASTTGGSIILKNSTSTGNTTIITGNTSASNFTLTLPAATGTILTDVSTLASTNTIGLGTVTLTGNLPDARNTVSNSTTTTMSALTTIGAAGAGTVNIPYTTSASTPITGSLKIGNGTAATNVGIGGGNVYVGGNLGFTDLVGTIGAGNTRPTSLAIGNNGFEMGTTCQLSWRNSNEITAPASGRVLMRGTGAAALSRLSFHTETSSDAAFQVSGTGITAGLADGTAGGSLTASGKLASTFTAPTALVTGNTTFAVTSSCARITGTNAVTIGTITGGVDGMTLTLVFFDGNVTITDTDGISTADSVDLAGTATNFVSAQSKILTLVYCTQTGGNAKWYEITRSDNK